jgi:hypothetical protein
MKRKQIGEIYVMRSFIMFIMNEYRTLVGKPEGKRPLGRPKHRWKNYIKMELGEIGLCGMDGIDLAWDRNQWGALVNMIKNLWVP